MQTFSAKPTDAELAGLLDPAGWALGITTESTPEHLIIFPRGFPIAIAIALAMLLPGVVYWLNPAVLPVAIAGAAIAIGMFAIINGHVSNQPPFVILDKIQRSLILPRPNLRVEADQIHEFVEVCTWYYWALWSRKRIWLRELSVLLHTDNGGFIRCSLIATTSPDIDCYANYFADFFGVELRVLKLTWRERRRLKRADSKVS